MLILVGPPGSGKTEQLLDEYVRVLRTAEPGAVLWLAPTWRSAADIRRRLVARLPGCFSPGITTFTRFARWVVDMMPEAIRPIDGLMKRQIVRRIVQRLCEQGRIEYFLPIVDKPGLLSLICQFISELKRYEIWPEHFQQACASPGTTRKDQELATIYAEYQQTLRRHKLYDEEGLFWSARDWLGRVAQPLAGCNRADQPGGDGSGVHRALNRLRLVVADGFTDFTRTQHEILEILARCAQQVCISLPLEAEPVREELFAKPLKTLDELRRRHRDVTVKQLERPAPPRWPGMDHLERWLFADPRQVPMPLAVENIEILAAARPIGELEQIGARIKCLLAEGKASADEVVVVFRTLDDIHWLVREVFGRLGIPFTLDCWPVLQSCPALKALVALLRLEVEDWPWSGLSAVLHSSYFQPDWPEWQPPASAAAVDRVLRELGVVEGKQQWLAALSAEERRTGGRQAEDELHNVRLARQVLHKLAQALEELPQQATLADWAEAWEMLAERTGLLRAMAHPLPGDARPPVADGDGWRQLQQTLRDSHRWSQLLDEPPPLLGLRQAVEILEDLLASQTAPGRAEELGRVRVLTAKSVRTLHVPYLFVAGLAEKAFPLHQSESRLYGDADRERLIQRGLPLVDRVEHSREEMLLFYEVVTRATRYLCLSYPALDEKGEPLSCSPYLQDLERICGPGRIRRSELTDLRPVSEDQQPPLSAQQFRLKAVHYALQGRPGLFSQLIAAAEADQCGTLGNGVRSIVGGLRIIEMRQQRDFTAAEGLLQSKPALAWLKARYNPQRTYQVTALERYARCPFSFFASFILEVEPLAELEIATDFLERGRLVHEVLAALHKMLNREARQPTSPAQVERERYQRLLDAAISQTFPPKPRQPLKAAMWEINLHVVRRWLQGYYEQCAAYDREQSQYWEEPPKPWGFELAFGHSTSNQEVPGEEPLVVQDGQDEVRLSGRIDRIDLGRAAGRAAFNVVDYKSGKAEKPSLDEVQVGTSLQLPVYVMAANELLSRQYNAYPLFAGYWGLSEQGFKDRNALKMYEVANGKLEITEDWSAMRQAVGKSIVRLVERIRGGLFCVYSQDDQCTASCPFRTVCRISQVRSLEKQPPP